MCKTLVDLKMCKLLLVTLLWAISVATFAAKPVYEIEIRNHLFYPSSLTIPEGVKVKLMIINRDPTPEEFESYELNREKVIVGNGKGIIFIGPLKAGRYPFFGEFNPKTAQGEILVVKEDEGVSQ